MMYSIRDLNKSCGMEVYRVEVSECVILWNSLVSSVASLYTAIFFWSSLMTISILVNKLDYCFVVDLLEPAMKWRFTHFGSLV